MIDVEDAVDHIPKKSSSYVPSHVFAHDTTSRTYSCTEWFSSYLVEVMRKRKIM